MPRKLLSVTLLMAVTLAGCLAIGGSNKTYKATVGQELLDLKTALDAGAISHAEFEQTKQRLLTHAD